MKQIAINACTSEKKRFEEFKIGWELKQKWNTNIETNGQKIYNVNTGIPFNWYIRPKSPNRMARTKLNLNENFLRIKIIFF
jgi:hypothetical protein